MLLTKPNGDDTAKVGTPGVDCRHGTPSHHVARYRPLCAKLPGQKHTGDCHGTKGNVKDRQHGPVSVVGEVEVHCVSFEA